MECSGISYYEDLLNLISKTQCYIQQDATVHRSVKPHILSVFGDIALAKGAEFKNYFQAVIATINQASVTTVDKVSETC